MPDTSRAYSGWRDRSRIDATIGATARTAWMRPSAVARSKRLMVVRAANSNMGTASSMSAWTAGSPPA